ncbi:protein cramped [Musca vetustissima]|uniref:protein cramped n=1 Tax=Musca vetustissima TaxID=27455 RepID=UPI002AB6C76A|nr:protein cramped [Musca vetustissima]
MDKGHLVAEKIATNNQPQQQQQQTTDNFCNKDDVVVVVNAAVKKEKSQTTVAVTAAEASDVTSSQTKATAATRGKEINEKKVEGKNINEFPSDTEELLGSLTTYNCHGTRTSARVIQKMRQDQQTRPTTPPPTNERENTRTKDERSTAQKTPSQVRANRPTWSNVERNHFFDALNEFGKDFEAIGNFINSKLKRRSPAIDVSFKSKDQVRQHYYQTYHKICKYVRFSEEIRKPAQELYALINYGEMRRKLQFVTDKHFMKLKNLVYHGHVTVRCKGKNIRIKTPSCKALRRLNQLDDSLEDIRLPSKIEVIISPANMEAFGRVQAIAQNPRCRTTVPLHKKLINFINMFQHKWRSMDVRVAEEARLMNSNDSSTSMDTTINAVQDPELCFLPKPGVTIHRPLLSITEYLSSVNICLTAYEERMGITHKGDILNSNERHASSTNNTSGSVPTMSSSCSYAHTAANSKRLRTESGSEKKSPEQNKRSRNSESLTENISVADEMPSSSSLTDLDNFQVGKQPESSSDELSDEIQELLSDSAAELNTSKEDLTIIPPMTTEISSSTTNCNLTTNPNPALNTSTTTTTTTLSQASSVRAKTSRAMNSKATRSVFKPLLNDDIIQSIRSGWTASKAGDITIGDLYVVLGHDSKLELDYYWLAKTKSHGMPNKESQTSANGVTGAAAPENEEPKESVGLSNKLKHLLLIANLSERKRKRPCTCDRNHAAKSRFEMELVAGNYVANRSPYINCARVGPNKPNESSSSVMFRQPMIPVRRTAIDPVKQLTTLTRQKMSRQILVQRLLLPSNGNSSSSSSSSSSPNNPSTSSAITTSSSSLRNTSQVPWNLNRRINVSTASSDLASTSTSSSPCVSTTTPITDDSTTDSQDLCRFLDSIDCDSRQHLLSSNVEEMSSLQQRDQRHQSDVHEETGDRTDGGPCSVQSIDSAYDEASNASFLNGLSPMHLIRDSTSNSRWLEENINDFSLTSLLGHLDDINASRDILDPSSSMSVISESSVDFRHKFQEIKALLPTQEKD